MSAHSVQQGRSAIEPLTSAEPANQDPCLAQIVIFASPVPMASSMTRKRALVVNVLPSLHHADTEKTNKSSLTLMTKAMKQ